MILTSSNPRPRIERMLTEVGELKRDVGRLESGYQDCYYDSQDVGRNLQSAEWPLRRAQSDNGQRDSSHEGRQADMYLSQAERSLQNNERDLSRMEMESNTAHRDFESLKQELNLSIQECSSHADAQATLQQARNTLEGAHNNHQQADSEASWADNKTRSAIRELDWADHNVRNIMYDRPGQDVSNDAYQASNRVNQAQWSVRDCDSNLSRATSYEDRSEQGLGQLEQQLRQALQQLPPG